MRAVQATRFGGPEVLELIEAPDPIAGPGQAVVAVSAAHVLFVETQVRSGWGSEYFKVKTPYTPGDGVTGQVIAVGEGVDPGWEGQRVAARTGGRGGYAEQAMVPAEGLVPVPDGVSLLDAAALLHDGPTALGLFENARVEPGEWVLVVGAGGGLGILLVQLAQAAGARVIGAARGRQKLDLARELGVRAVVDYSQPNWTDQLRQATGGVGLDVVFDGVGGDVGGAAFEATADGGRFSAHGAPSGAFATIDLQEANRRDVTVRGIEQVQFAPDVWRRLAAQALSEAAAGRIRAVIGQTFPLERAAEAHAAMETRRVIGTTLLVVEGEMS